MLASVNAPAFEDRLPGMGRDAAFAGGARPTQGCGPCTGRLHRLATWEDDAAAFPAALEPSSTAHLDLTTPPSCRVSLRPTDHDRLAIALADGARVEAVHMPRALANEAPRARRCLSSQVGCAMGCTFCRTAQMGLVRNLAAHEIVAQLYAVLLALGPRSAERLNLVFMGMGEPLHNVEAVVGALDVLCDPAGLGVAPSRVTVSTAGHVPGLARLAESRYRPELAISVNAVTDALRSELMPVNRRWPLEALRTALDAWPRRPHEKITLEYVLLAGKNDGERDAELLAAWIGDLRHVVNVIPFNAWGDATSPYAAPSEAALQRFASRLSAAGCLVKVRRSRGRDVRGACGTLVTSSQRLVKR
ncbi:MAG: 23S rRNA (adenine(2503)-C(2))-methyltransferase RlmN [Polyangiaceae bacterium]